MGYLGSNRAVQLVNWIVNTFFKKSDLSVSEVVDQKYKEMTISYNGDDYTLTVPTVERVITSGSQNPVSSGAISGKLAEKLDSETFTEFQSSVILKGGKVISNNSEADDDPEIITNHVNVYGKIPNNSNLKFQIMQDAEPPQKEAHFAAHTITGIPKVYLSASGIEKCRFFIIASNNFSKSSFKSFIEDIIRPTESNTTKKTYQASDGVIYVGEIANQSTITSHPIDVPSVSPEVETTFVVYFGTSYSSHMLTTEGLGNAFDDGLDSTSINAVMNSVVTDELTTKMRASSTDLDDIMDINNNN